MSDSISFVELKPILTVVTMLPGRFGIAIDRIGVLSRLYNRKDEEPLIDGKDGSIQKKTK